MSRRDSLEPIQDAGDREVLRGGGLSSLDAIWRQLGKSDDDFFQKLPDDCRNRIFRDLIRAAGQESSDGRTGGLTRYWPDLLLFLTVLLLLGLGCRAFWMRDSVAIALRDLRAGERLRPETLHGAKGLNLPDGKQPGPALRLIRNVPAGDYIFSEDLERFEVIAASSIPAGAAIPADAVRQEWRPFRKKESTALLDQVVGNRAAQEIRQGATIRSELLEAESVLMEQLVARRRLPRLHPITAADFRLEKRPRQPGALVKPEAAMGRYPLQEIEAGTSLVEDRLSPGALAADALSGRQLMTLHVHPPSFRLVPQLPARVGLAATAPGERNLLLSDVLVMSVESGKDGPALVVALTEHDLKGLIPLLPEAQMFVLQPFP